MLDEFIQANQLTAKIEPRLIRHRNGIQSELYHADSRWLLLVHLVHDRLDLEKVRELTRETFLEEATKDDALTVTGYSREFLPPISIYGVHVIVDSQVVEKETVYTFVGDEQTLILPSSEILSANEGIEVADIVKRK